MEREDITARLPGIAAPALVIHGSLDTAIPLSQAEALLSRRARYRISPGALCLRR